MLTVKERLEALRRARDSQRPNGGVLISLGDDQWLTISATTLNNHRLIIKGEKEAALQALADCKRIFDHSGTEPQKGNNHE